jgi:prepilin-type N-terminal cleavage/methylation domain-containing protein
VTGWRIGYRRRRAVCASACARTRLRIFPLPNLPTSDIRHPSSELELLGVGGLPDPPLRASCSPAGRTRLPPRQARPLADVARRPCSSLTFFAERKRFFWPYKAISYITTGLSPTLPVKIRSNFPGIRGPNALGAAHTGQAAMWAGRFSESPISDTEACSHWLAAGRVRPLGGPAASQGETRAKSETWRARSAVATAIPGFNTDGPGFSASRICGNRVGSTRSRITDNASRTRVPSAFTLPDNRQLIPDSPKDESAVADNSVRSRETCGFTFVELLVVTAIIGVLMVLVTPAVRGIKSAGDVTDAAARIRDALEGARNYAMANNTYVWVGFYEEDGSVPSATPTAKPGTGRFVISIVMSKDGTTVYNPNSNSNPDPIDPTRLMQVGKLVRIDNIHLPLFAVGSGNGDTFDTRPTLQFDPVGVGYNDSRFGEINLSGNESAPTTNSRFPFQYPVGSPAPAAQYTFRKTLQFNPRGESSINSTYKMRRVVEIGLQPTHGNLTDLNNRNVVAIQFSGVGGNFKVYQR